MTAAALVIDTAPSAPRRDLTRLFVFTLSLGAGVYALVGGLAPLCAGVAGALQAFLNA